VWPVLLIGHKVVANVGKLPADTPTGITVCDQFGACCRLCGQPAGARVSTIWPGEAAPFVTLQPTAVQPLPRLPGNQRVTIRVTMGN